MKVKVIALSFLALVSGSWVVSEALGAPQLSTSALTCIPGINCTTPSNPGGAGTWTHSTYKNNYGQRDYYLYVPKQGSTKAALPLLLMLHGCAQGAADIAHSTGLNLLADKYGFAVLYPEQNTASNSSRCWNWFVPDNFVRGGGEMGIIMGMINQVSRLVPLNTNKIIAGGFSAGAALVSNLLACHSDVFAGAVIHSGLEFQAATSSTEAWMSMSQGSKQDLKKTSALAARCTGAGAKIRPIFVIHGKSDFTVNPVNGERIVSQFTQVNDLLDDGQANGTQNLTVLKSENGKTPSGRTYQMISYGGQGHIQIVKLLVDGMSHAWSGGASGGSYTDPQGPNASEMIVQAFFSSTSR
jgi:poly(hydroxyalkanoate) depolymerase family esterase